MTSRGTASNVNTCLNAKYAGSTPRSTGSKTLQRGIPINRRYSSECSNVRSLSYLTGGPKLHIWATIVLRQAYDVADWIVGRGYTSYEPRGYYCGDEADDMCVPYDASTWRDWVDRELWNCEHSSLSNEHIKSVAVKLVRRKHIKIPLNSGLPHYYWLLNGYRFAEFCRIYACIEYIYDDKFNFHELEMTLKHHMDHVMRAKTGFRLIYVMWICSTGEEFEDVYTAKVLEKVIFMYRDRKQSAAAIKIQCLFRMYRSKNIVDTIRAHPDNLFHPDYAEARQNILSIDATCFAPTP